MKHNAVNISDFISFAIEERDFNAELVDACLDFIGEDALIDLADGAKDSGQKSKPHYTYSPIEFFEENKSKIMEHAGKIENLGTMIVDGRCVCITLDKHSHFVEQQKSALTTKNDLDHYKGFARGVTEAVIIDLTDAMCAFL